LLRVIHEDGTAAVQRLEPKLLHRLDCIADSAEVLRLYPSLRHERFYPAMLDAIRRQLAARVRAAAAVVVCACPRVIVMRLPAGRSNQRLCFDCVARVADSAEWADCGAGVCFVADRGEGLTEAKLLFQELSASVTLPLSLFCVEEAVDGFNALPFILARLQADRFVYVDRGIALTARGWRQAVQTLGGHGHGVRFFEIVDDAGVPDRINGSASAACFGWTTAALLPWIPSAPRFLRGIFRSSGLPKPGSADPVLTGAAIRIERTESSRFADLVDEDLLATGRHVALHA
jgi:hypothetical protein